MEILIVLILVAVVAGILVATRLPRGRASHDPVVTDREAGRN